MGMKYWRSDNGRGKQKHSEKNSTGTVLFSEIPTRTALRRKRGFRSEKSENNHLMAQPSKGSDNGLFQGRVSKAV
jgi:hypothetical protein